MEIIRENGTGDCFEANGDYIIEVLRKIKDRKTLSSYRICHGLVTGQKSSKVAGKVFPHAWIEINGEIIIDNSNGKQIVGNVKQLYTTGRIIEKSVRRYSPKEYAKLVLRHGHYGQFENLEEDVDGRN